MNQGLNIYTGWISTIKNDLRPGMATHAFTTVLRREAGSRRFKASLVYRVSSRTVEARAHTHTQTHIHGILYMHVCVEASGKAGVWFLGSSAVGLH